MPDGESIRELVHRYRTHIKAYKSPETKEAEIRQQFIDPFWRLLGWDVGDTKGVGPADAEVRIERNVESAEAEGLHTRRPDYMFRSDGLDRFLVEAKKPSIDIDADHDAIFQAKQYAWNKGLPFAILTNFEQFRLYDTSPTPVLNLPRRGLIAEFSLDYDRYESQWDAINAAFGRAAVGAGSLDELFRRVKKARAGKRLRTVDRNLFDVKGAEPVDQVFLAYLDAHRRHFAAAIYRDNRGEFPEAATLHGAARLTEAVQRVMDRLVFMRVIEDRGVVPWGSLRSVLDRVGAEGGAFYEQLCAQFTDYNSKYNGYLFKPHFSEKLEVDGTVLADFTRRLYPPDGPWRFDAIGDDILGTVYERFLGNTIAVRKGQASVEEKMEVRHAGGVYYTPRFVVDSIIRRVVGPKVAGRTPAEVLDVKILDPACGSGSFLVAALQYLFDYCIGAVTRNPALAGTTVPALGDGGARRKKKSEIAFQDRDGAWYLAPDFRAALLTRCIHGVDIDQQAVEVTVMSLYLKMLESRLPEHWATLWVERQLLPALDNNIQCGNSLIDPAGYDAFLMAKKGALFGEDADTAFRINRFDWTSRTKGFGRLLDPQAVKERGRGGFDCIIGNPPYIRVQELNKWAPEECAYYKWKYQSAAKGNYDIYVVFTERALSLLSSGGLLGFIMPHKFWQAAYGAGLRKIIADGKHVRAIVDFGHQQVFQKATTYTAIHILGHGPNENGVSYARFAALSDGVGQCAQLDTRGQAESVEAFNAELPCGDVAWRFAPPHRMRIYESVSRAGTLTLGKAASRLFQGVRTSMNEVFVLRASAKTTGRYRSEFLAREVELEPYLLKPFLDGDCIRRYSIGPTNAVAIFPYSNPKSEGGVDLVSPEELASKYPKTWAYLSRCEKALRARERGSMDTDSWYAYGRTQNLDLFGTPRLLVPDMMDRAAFAVDGSGESAFVSGYGIIFQPMHRELLAYFAGLLNSELLSRYLKSVSTPLRGGWYRTFPQFLRQIPIKLPETTGERKLAERITASVRAIMDAKAALRRPKLSDRETRQLEAEIESHENRINEAVFALYGVPGLPT